jgi:hypothetical protein
MDIQWTAVAATGGLVTATVAIIALVLGGRRSRIALQTDLLLKYYDKFYSLEMHRIRKRAAEKMIEGKYPNFELEDVLDYFGIIGALLEKKALDNKLTYGLFDWWILRYWYCANDYIQARRKDPDDPDLEMWSYLERMVKQFVCRKGKNLPAISDKVLKRFLGEESRSSGCRTANADGNQGAEAGIDHN